jgi:RHS repeat-associated protein
VTVRRHADIPVRCLIALILLLSALAAWAAPAEATVPAGAIRFTHDADGRLTGVVEPEAGTALYGWDAVGNLAGVTRHPAGQLSILQLSPERGEVGQSVTIEGTGFSSSPESNTIKFNGTATAVLEATATALTVKVPTGAESGPVTVSTAGEGPVSSSRDFTVGNQSGPSISEISPTIVATGGEFTIHGSHFDGAPEDLITLNRSESEIVSATESSITVKVPRETLGGRVRVATPDGSTIGPDLFVPPGNAAASSVGDTGRFSIGEPTTTTISKSGTVGLKLFDAEGGEKVAFTLSEATFAGKVSIWSPRDVQLGGSETSFTTSGGGIVEPVILPESGTYTVRILGTGEATGSVKLNTYKVNDVTGSITPVATAEGTTQHVALTTPGQVAKYSMPISAGETVALKTTNTSFNGGFVLRLLNPNGTTFESRTFGGAENLFWGPFTFTTAGTYTLEVDPNTTVTGSVDLKAWEDPVLTGQTLTASPEGDTKTSTITIPGQHEVMTLAGTSGEYIQMVTKETTLKGGEWSLVRPNGSAVFSGPVWTTFSPTSNPVRETYLPETGTYKLYIYPTGEATGSVKMSEHSWSPENVTGSITPVATAEGTTQHVALTTPGQVAKYSMPISAGETVALKTTNTSFNGGFVLRLLNPNGTTFESRTFGGAENLFWGPFTFTTAGTYTLEVDPNTTVTGSVDLKAWEDPVLTGSITPTTEGETKELSIGVPGQRQVMTFAGTAGQTITVKAIESTITRGSMWIVKPDGTQLGGTPTFTPTTAARLEVSLPTTGTYKVIMDPESDYVGAVKLTAYLGSHVAYLGPLPSRSEFVSFSTSDTSGRQEFADIGTSGNTEPTTVFADYQQPASSRSEGAAAPPESPAQASPAQATQVSGVPASARKFKPRGGAYWYPPQSSRGSRGWVTEERSSPWTRAWDLAGKEGDTALTGQVLAQDGQPLPGVHVALEGSAVTAQTDGAGRFLLEGVPAGHQILIVDGGESEGRRYGSYEMGVDLVAHKTTQLEYTVWLTPLDPDGTRIVAGSAKHGTILRNPRIPGLEVKLPAGTVIRTADGRRVKSLNITAIPVDRTPSPLPAFQTIPLYYTIQPGRAYLSKGARIIYPNWTHLPPGERVSFWNYDASGRGWYIYGHGSVSADAKQIVPDPGVRVWKLSGAMISGTPTPPGTAPGESGAGDPVDMHSGLFTYHKRDLTIPDTIPIDIERTYRQMDSNSYAFGKGTQSLYNMELWSVHNYQDCSLILPDGRRVYYKRTSPGTGWTNAVYRSEDLPGPYFGSEVRWDGATPGFDLELTDGTTYVFGEVAPLQGIRNSAGEELKLTREHGQSGNITKITSPHGHWVKFTYDGSNRITEITDNGGQHLKYAYTGGLLTEATNVGGDATEYAYDAAGGMTSVTNPRGIEYLKTSYEASGRVEKQTTADGAAFEFSYALGETGQVTSTTVTDPRGSTKEDFFNAEGRTTKEVVEPGTEYEQTTSYELQPETGLLLSETDPAGNVTTYEYDGQGNPTEITRLAGTAEEATWTASYQPGTSWMTEEVDPLGHATHFEYGLHGELLSGADPLGHKTTYKYSGAQLSAVTNPLGQTTQIGYTGGALTSVTDPLGGTTTRFVDGLGRVLSVISPEGRKTRYRYDERGDVLSTTSPSGAETSFGYDADGNLVKIVAPGGGETTRSYDVMDRLVSETDPLGHTAEWGYDAAGDLTAYTNRDGTTTAYSYDPLRRLTSAAYGVSGLTAESSVSYGYNDANRPVTIDDTASGEYGLAYDGLGEVTTVESPQGTIGYGYDAAGRRATMTVPGLSTTEYSYDAANRLTGISRGSESVSMAYDAANRLQGITVPDGVEEIYGRDAGGEATSIEYRQGKEELGDINYAYDQDGLLEAEWGSYARIGLPEALSSTTYNAANELTEREGQELSYDADGNLVSEGSTGYEWNARGQLTHIGGEGPTSFSYDPFGRRVSRTVGGQTTESLYDGVNVVEESVGSTSASLLTGLAPDQLFSRTTEGGVDSYLTDRLGSVLVLADESGKPQTEYSYQPFGSVLESGAASGNPFQFTGREDDGTGLEYDRARYYSPAQARFISQDPMGMAGSGVNLYLYATGDPLDYTDPSGLVPNPFTAAEEFAEERAREVGEFVSSAEEVASEAVSDAKGAVEWGTDFPARYEEVNNTIECIAEFGVHLEIQGRCRPEGGKPGEEGPNPPEPPSTPPPGVPGTPRPIPVPVG